MSEYLGHELVAYEMGVAAAEAAASWTVDGNTKAEFVPAVLEMIEAGDPAAWDYLPAMPNLSGEFADAPTPQGLYETIIGEDHADAEERAGLAYETLVGNVMDALADAWEEGVADTFETACERELRKAVA